jgi:hypothetical protein
MACRRESGFKDTKFWWIMGGFFSFLFKAQQPCHAILSAHVIPAQACGELGIYGQKASRHLWLRFCLHCPAIRKEEDRLSHTLGKELARSWQGVGILNHIL